MSANPYGGMGYYSGLVSGLTGQLQGEAEAEKRRREQEALEVKASILMADRAAKQERADQAAGFRREELDLSEKRHQLAVKKFEQPKPAKTAALTPYQTENLRQKQVGYEADLASNEALTKKVRGAASIMEQREVDPAGWGNSYTEDWDTGYIPMSVVDSEAKKEEKVLRSELLDKLDVDNKRLRDLISGGLGAAGTQIAPAAAGATMPVGAADPAGAPGAAGTQITAPAVGLTMPVGAADPVGAPGPVGAAGPVDHGATEIDEAQVVSVAIESLGSAVEADRLQAKEYLLSLAKEGNQEARAALLKSIGR